VWNSQLLRYAGHRMADMYASSIASVKPHVLKLLSFAPNIAVTAVAVTAVAYRFALPMLHMLHSSTHTSMPAEVAVALLWQATQP